MTDAQIIDAILRREGGYVNRKADRGGPTNFGVTIKTLTAWRGRPCDAIDVKDMREDEARAIYAARYLAPFKDAPETLRPQLVDIGVLSGPSRAVTLLIDAKKAANASSRTVATELAIARLKFYGQIVHNDHEQAENINGWINRACEFL